MTFKELTIIEPILKALKNKGYNNPTPIQEKTIPFILDGSDLLGFAQTGTGKTAAFCVPIIQRLSLDKEKETFNKTIKGLIISPTRELAIQINDCLKDYTAFTGIEHTAIFGGIKKQQQIDTLRKGVDILVATPGRLLDLMNDGHVDLSTIQYFVLDEADRMLDMGFINDIKRLLRVLPKEKQTLLFSATSNPTISGLSKQILNNPKTVNINPKQTDGKSQTIEQYIYFVEKQNKKDLLIRLLEENTGQSALVFSRTKHGADKIARILCKAGIGSEAFHGNKSQNARVRALTNFRTNKIRVLIATDIAARGIDITDLEIVINYDLPDEVETYVHRIGRTGRAGKTGTALSFCADDEKIRLKNIQKWTGSKLLVAN